MADSDATLNPDVTAIQNGTTNTMAALTVVLKYCSAVGSINTGPRSFVIDGSTDTTDPFAGTAFQTAIKAIQSHIYSFMPMVVMPLGNWANSVSVFGYAFPIYANSILATLAEIGSGQPTASQRASVMASFAQISTGLAGLHDTLQATQPALLQFIEWKTADYPTLIAGPDSIGVAITNMETYFANAASVYEGPLGEGIVAIFSDLSSSITASMQNSLTEVTAASTASADATAACSALLNLMSDLVAKCNSTIKFVEAADDATFASALQRIDLRTAVTSWGQLANFVPTAL